MKTDFTTQHHLYSVINSAELGLWEYDAGRKKATWSRRCQEMYGIPPDVTIDYERFLAAVHPLDRERVDNAITKSLETGELHEVEMRTIWPDGSIHWIASRGRGHFDESGRPVRLTGAVLDITKLKKIEEELEHARAEARAQADEMKAILDAVPAMTFISHDPLCRDMTSSTSAYELLRLTRGANASKSAPENERPHFQLYDQGRELTPDELPMQQAALSGQEVRNKELEIRLEDGTRIHVFGHAVPLFDDDRKVRGSVGAFVDITERKRAELELHQSKVTLQSFYDSAPFLMGVAELDGDRTVAISGNRAMAEFLGRTPRELPGHSGAALGTPPEVELLFVEAYRRSQREGNPVRIEFLFPRTESSCWLRATVAFLGIGPTGNPRFSFVAEDVTERKVIEAQLRDGEERLRQQRERYEFVAEASDVGFWFCDLPFDKLIWDRRVKAHFWLPEDTEVTIQIFYERLHAEDRERTRKAIEYSIAKHTPYDIEYRTVASDNQRFRWIRALGRTFYDKDGKPTRFDGITMDVTTRKSAEEALRLTRNRYREMAESLERQVQIRTSELQERNQELVRASENLHELSARLMRLQDEERRRIARELHDSAGQLLTTIGLQLFDVRTRANKSAPVLTRSLDEIQQIVQQLQREIRTTSYLLHPPLLDESGLFSSLSWYVEGFSKRSGIQTKLEMQENFGRLSANIELAIYRLVQESVTNIHRHSGSKTALVRVTREAEAITVEVQDEGRGMTEERLKEIRTGGSGVGLRGMTERMREFGGELRIESGAFGTRILATIPEAGDRRS